MSLALLQFVNPGAKRTTKILIWWTLVQGDLKAQTHKPHRQRCVVLAQWVCRVTLVCIYRVTSRYLCTRTTEVLKSPLDATALVTENVYGAKGSPPVNCVSSAFSQPSFSRRAFLSLSQLHPILKPECDCVGWMGNAMLFAC